MGTNISVTIGGHTVTGDIQNIMYQAEDLSGARICEIIIINELNEWDNDFDIKDAIDINIDGNDEWDGYVDDVDVYTNPKFTDLPMMKIRGLDYGFDLVKLFIDKDYKDDEIDDIIDDALSEASSEITYSSPTSAPTNSIDFKRRYLGDGFRSLCKDADWTFYVHRDKSLHLFPIGDGSEYLDGGGGRADVDLDSIAGSLANNILDFKEGEKRGSKLWNHVEVTSGYWQDHTTDENAGDFTEGSDVTITDESTTKFVTFWRGRGAIKATRNTSNGVLLVTLDINNSGSGRYDYTSLDLQENTLLSYLLFCGFDGAPDTIASLRFRLEDVNGDLIEFRKHDKNNSASKHDRTDNIINGEWYKVTVPIGTVQTITNAAARTGWNWITQVDNIPIEGAYASAALVDDAGSGRGTIRANVGQTPYSVLDAGEWITISNAEDSENDGTYEVFSITESGRTITITTVLPTSNATDTTISIDSAFNWDSVYKIHWRTGGSILYEQAGQDGHIIIDDLTIPTVDAKSIEFDQTSINAYGKRMLPVHRPDIRSQKELDALAVSILDKQKDPPDSLELILVGNTDIKYTGQSLDVNAPPYGIASDTKYRIQFIQHKITLKGQSPVRDYEYTTKVRLIKDQVSGASQKVSPDQFIDPWSSALIGLRNGLVATDWWRQMHLTPYAFDSWIGSQEDASGETFPSNPFDGQTWTLTAVSGSDNPGEYAYISDLNITRAGAYTTANIQSDGGAGKGTITANGGTPFSGLIAGDVITTSRCENQENNLSYTIDTVTDTVITVTVLIDTTNVDDTSIIIDRFVWVITGVTYIADTTDFSSVEWPTDQMAIEVRPWTANFSIIWDDKDDTPPTDWNHFKWGSLGNENSSDATITYADATSVDVNFGQDTNLGNGAWWVYWDTDQKTGGDYDVQFTQTYSTASGAGKGVLAQVFVDNAGSNAPDILMYNSYAPTIGTGSLVAYAIQSKHISADFITGKNFQSVSGNTSVTFTSAGIIGKNSGTTQFSLNASTGKATFSAGKAVIDTGGITINDTTGNIITFKNDAGSTTLGWLRTTGGEIRLISNGGAIIALDNPTSGDMLITGAGEVGIQSPVDDITVFPGSGKDFIISRQDAGHADPNFRPRVTGTSQVGEDGLMFAAVFSDEYSATTNSHVNIISRGTGDVNITAADDLDMNVSGDVTIDTTNSIVLNAGSGAGDGISLIGGTSFVRVDFGDTDIRIHGDDDVVITADDDVVIQPTGDLRFVPSGAVTINGLGTFSGTRVFDDNAGNTHTVVVLKGFVRSWVVV